MFGVLHLIQAAAVDAALGAALLACLALATPTPAFAAPDAFWVSAWLGLMTVFELMSSIWQVGWWLGLLLGWAFGGL